MLPKRISKPVKRSSRWRSAAHCNFVRSHACSACGSEVAIEVAHVRLGIGAGMGQKPDDWRTVSLCKVCHTAQHSIDDLIEAFCMASPKEREIREPRNG